MPPVSGCLLGLCDAVKICGLPAAVDPQAADAAAALRLCAARDLARSVHRALLCGLQVELEGPDVTRRATDWRLVTSGHRTTLSSHSQTPTALRHLAG